MTPSEPIKQIEDVHDISAITYGFMASKALFAALDLDLFTRIEGGINSAAALARATSISENRVVTLLAALKSVGLIAEREGRLINAAAGDSGALRSGGPEARPRGRSGSGPPEGGARQDRRDRGAGRRSQERGGPQDPPRSRDREALRPAGPRLPDLDRRAALHQGTGRGEGAAREGEGAHGERGPRDPRGGRGPVQEDVPRQQGAEGRAVQPRSPGAGRLPGEGESRRHRLRRDRGGAAQAPRRGPSEIGGGFGEQVRPSGGHRAVGLLADFRPRQDRIGRRGGRRR
ncbi:MAG: hypothetical protein LAO51_15280 [Acidobacteriia bacterium]|nr:hypothetical protein [Terriglobia bacterium]